MEIAKITILAILIVLVALFFKNGRQEIAQYIVTAGGVILLAYGLLYLSSAKEFIMTIGELMGDNVVYIKLLVKMVGVAYVSELGAGICKDAGYHSLGGQVEMVGKILMFIAGMPIMTAVIDVITTN